MMYSLQCLDIKSMCIVTLRTKSLTNIIGVVTHFDQFLIMEADGQVDRTMDLLLTGLGFDSQCWWCVEVSGKLHVPH